MPDIAGGAALDRTAPDAVASRSPCAAMPSDSAENDQDHDADDADRHVLPVQIGPRAFLHGGGDLLHPGVAGILYASTCLAVIKAVDQRRDTAGDDQISGPNPSEAVPLCLSYG